MDNGFIMLPRDYFKSCIWLNDGTSFSDTEAWLDILRSVSFSAKERCERVGRHLVKWMKGEWPVSLRSLSSRWGWSVKRIRRFLSRLCEAGMIIVMHDRPISVIRLVGEGYEPASMDCSSADVNTMAASAASSVGTAAENHAETATVSYAKTAANQSEASKPSVDNPANQNAGCAGVWQADTANTSTNSHDRLDQEITAMQSNETWMENMFMRFSMTKGLLTEKLKQFQLDCRCRGVEGHNSLREAQCHFVNWLMVTIKKEEQQKKNQENERSSSCKHAKDERFTRLQQWAIEETEAYLRKAQRRRSEVQNGFSQ